MVKKNLKLYQNALKKCSKFKGVFMNKKLEKINGLTAKKILKKTKQLDKVPVDLDLIVKHLDIYKFQSTFDDMKEREQEKYIAGLVLATETNIGIFYNKNDKMEKKRFTIAHEIGHCCLHSQNIQEGYIEFLRNDGFENEHEIAASVFASKLLIPKKSLKRIYKRLIIPSVKGLSDIFEVPRNIMIHRLNELEMMYYDEEKDRFVFPYERYK